jgi:hypothetical protein
VQLPVLTYIFERRCNCLFFVLINNLENQTYAMELDKLKDRIHACSKVRRALRRATSHAALQWRMLRS